MPAKKPENPNVFVKAFKFGGFSEHKLDNGWTILEDPSDSSVVLAVLMDQPLQPEKIDSYLRAAKLTEETYEQWKIKALKDNSNQTKSFTFPSEPTIPASVARVNRKLRYARTIY